MMERPPHRLTESLPHRARTLWLIGMLHAFTHLYGVALLPLYLEIQRDFQLAMVEQATLLVTVIGLAYFIPSYLLGVLADRFNRTRLLTIGLLTNALGFIAIATAPSYGWAIAGAALAGFGGSFYHPAATALIAQLYPEARGRALGLVGIGASVGFFFGPMYTGWRAGGGSGWRSPVLELGLLGMVATVVFVGLVRDVPAREPQRELEIKAASPRLFPTAALWVFFVCSALLLSLRDFAGSAMGTSASLFFQKAHQFGTGLTGVALSGIFIASAVSNPLFGRLSDRGRMRWLAGLLLVAAGLVFVFPRVPAVWSVPVLLAYGFFFMATYPVTEAALMESVPDAVRGRIFGLFIMISGLIGNVAHWAMGDWVGRMGPAAGRPSGYYTLYGVLALLVLASLAALPFLRGIRKREHLDDRAGAAALRAWPATK